MTTRRWMRLWALLVLWWLGSAQAGEPTTQPLLRLETGMHTAIIRRIATDAAGRWAVTVSDDKTARIWDVASGEQVGILRVPQGEGNEGKLYAVAMSPDGAQIAVGGWTKPGSETGTVYIFDRATQHLLRPINDLPKSIFHLAYSSDGRWLAAGLSGQNGIRVFDPTSGKEVGRDSKYAGDSYSVEFSPAGSPGGLRLLSTSYDGQVRLHSVKAGRLTLSKLVRPGGGGRPYSARFSPDGRWIAIGFANRPVVQILDALNLSEFALPDVSGVDNGYLTLVAWSANGRSLVAKGVDMTGKESIRLWSVGNWSRLGDVPLSDNTVMDLVALPEAAGESWLFAGGGPMWGVVKAQGQVAPQEGKLADLREQRDQVRLSTDGHQFRFGYEKSSKTPYRFDINRRELALETAASAGAALDAARIEAPGFVVKDWQNNTAPTLNGQPIMLQPSEQSRSLAITPNGQRFALGTSWTLRFFDRTGQALWQQVVPGEVWAVNISADARWVVAGYGDGTIRWHRIEDGKEVLAFFPHADRKRWVLWTPEGYYDASPDAEDLIGYHLNHGKEQAGEFVSARQLRETFYQPNLISQRLGPQGDELMRQAVAKRGDVRELLRAGTTPELVLESAPVIERLDGYRPVLRIQNAGQGVGRLILRIDGQEIDGRRVGSALSPGRRVELDPLPLTLEARKVTVELVDGRGIASKPIEIPVKVADSTRAASAAATLHVLAVGISAYRDKSLERGVAFAAKDAQAVADAFKTGARGLFAKVLTTVLPNEQASRDNILQAGRILGSAKPEDTVVIYMAGHGTSADGDYHFVPWETRYTNFESLRKQALAADQLRELLAGIVARKVLVLLDTCSSGTFTINKGRAIDDKASLDRFQRMTGRAMMAAAADEQMALEGENQHGVFTSVLLSGLQGAADKNRDGTVIVTELGEYIDEQVPAITKRKWRYEQFPMMELRGSSFALTQAGK